jgi:hypothetical protein
MPILWPVTQNLNPNPTIQVLMGGLLGFCYNGRHGCEVGVYETGNHQLMMEVSNNLVGANVPLPGDWSRIKLTMEGVNPDPKFLNKPHFGRYKGDPNDFRFLIDLEGYDDGGLKGPLHKVQGYFERKIFISHGTFHTFWRTKSTFKSPDLATQGLGHFPYVIGCNIDLHDDQQMFLYIDDAQAPAYIFNAHQGVYRIILTNYCSDDQGKEGDFGEVFNLLTDPALAYQVEVDDDEGPNPETLPIPPLKGPFIGLSMAQNDNAPCMGAGFGQTDGFPPFE